MREIIISIEWSGLPNVDWKVSLWYSVEDQASRNDARYLSLHQWRSDSSRFSPECTHRESMRDDASHRASRTEIVDGRKWDFPGWNRAVDHHSNDNRWSPLQRETMWTEHRERPQRSSGENECTTPTTWKISWRSHRPAATVLCLVLPQGYGLFAVETLSEETTMEMKDHLLLRLKMFN